MGKVDVDTRAEHANISLQSAVGFMIFHKAAEKAKIRLAPRQGIHSLRHSIAHHLLDSGASLPVVQKQLRHKSLASTGIYLEADGADVDQWRAKAITGTGIPS